MPATDREEVSPSVRRLDPSSCGCTDCQTGYSRPWDEVSEEELLACAHGEIDNATGGHFRIEDEGGVNFSYDPIVVVQRLDPSGCGCTDCQTGHSRPWNEASEDLLLACARGEIDNATNGYLIVNNDEVSFTYEPVVVVHRLDPSGCGCTDCQSGSSRPWDEVSEELLLACACGEIDNATGGHLIVEDDGEVIFLYS